MFMLYTYIHTYVEFDSESIQINFNSRYSRFVIDMPKITIDTTHAKFAVSQPS